MTLLVETRLDQPGANAGLDVWATSGGLVAVIRPIDVERALPAPPFARRWSGNLLKLAAAQLAGVGGGRIIINSGTLSEDAQALDPRNWMAPGLAALTAHLESLDPAARAAGVRLLLEPCSRHILHDAPTASVYLRQLAGESFGLALNPTALFEPSMLPCREDHLQRIAESLAPHAAALILSDARLDPVEERLVPCEPGRGAFDLPAVLAACLPLLPSHAPVIIRPHLGEPLAEDFIDSIRPVLGSRISR